MFPSPCFFSPSTQQALEIQVLVSGESLTDKLGPVLVPLVAPSEKNNKQLEALTQWYINHIIIIISTSSKHPHTHTHSLVKRMKVV